MAADTQPLVPVEIQLYEEKVKARLAYAVVATFAALLALWTYKAPMLPGETVGIVIGTFATILGGLGQFYWQQKKQP